MAMVKPVLIYISKENCGGCQQFERDREWEKTKLLIGDHRATFIKFFIQPDTVGTQIPDVLTEKDYMYPMIILADPTSYYQFFTPDDKLLISSWTIGAKIRGIRFNTVMQNGRHIWAGKSNTANNIHYWFERVAPQLLRR